jgi:hypothetical protein
VAPAISSLPSNGIRENGGRRCMLGGVVALNPCRSSCAHKSRLQPPSPHFLNFACAANHHSLVPRRGRKKPATGRQPNSTLPPSLLSHCWLRALHRDCCGVLTAGVGEIVHWLRRIPLPRDAITFGFALRHAIVAA